jgi:hypothetical protein
MGGCVTVRKKWLAAINGYDQHPVFETGFHANAYDVHMRFKNLGLHIMWHPSLKLYHAWHPTTGEDAQPYYRQVIVTKYRGLNGITQAYDGLDPAQILPFPPELEAELQAYDKEQAGQTAVDKRRGWRHILARQYRRLRK